MAISQCRSCGEDFTAPPSKGRKFCSPRCASDSLKKPRSELRIRSIWRGMRRRCNSKLKNFYAYYGSRGISVCRQWDSSFDAFLSWAITSGYRDDLELDRIDNNKGYSPSNCRWVNRFQQMANTRKRSDAESSKYKGVSWNQLGRNWRAQITNRSKNIHIGCFPSEIEAAKAYDKVALKLHNRHAFLNFPQGGVKS